jgi:selenide,water dikinase
VLSAIPSRADDRVLVDYRTSDDAGVYRWEGGPALVQTVDFFTPIVDDPYIYGQIAAANALSDVYAMGGRPVTALAIAAFPKDLLDGHTGSAIFAGGFDKLREAGVALLGGHTVQDPEVKFGYAVTGAIDPARILTNAGARPGDVLLLTKPLGTGVIGTAIKFERVEAAAADEAITSMRTLNKAAAEALLRWPMTVAHACTDVTGFGLLGHTVSLARASGVTVSIDAASVPLFDGVLALVELNRSGGLSSNRDHFSREVGADSSVNPDRLDLLYDPQTSGGLLVAVEPAAADEVGAALSRAGVRAARIGEVGPARPDIRVVVRG